MKPLTIGILAGGAALLVLGYQHARKAIGGFSFEIVGYGRPTFNGYNLTVPLKIEANNPTSLPINVDMLDGEVYLNKAGTWVLGAVVKQPVTLQPGKQTVWIHPEANLQAIFGGDLIQTITAAAEIQRTKKLQLRADVGARYGMITIPKQSFIETVDL